MRLSIVVLALSIVTMASAGEISPAIIPKPELLQEGKGAFELKRSTRIETDDMARPTGEYLANRLRGATGFPLKVVAASKAQAGKGDILLTTQGAKPGLPREGYELSVTPRSVVIRSSDPAGLFYGVQTLLQLLPAEVFAKVPAKDVDWRIPTVDIGDEPRFAWRGLLLDVARHFYSKEEMKQVFDLMALHKLNMFQWHLTDDQGWRIEIKKYPRLTEIGAWRKGIGFGLDPKSSTAYGPDGRYGGYYTQADIRELVAYAQARHITIVPEIEMPGHASGALSAYPEFSCFGGPYNTDQGGGVFAGVYCPGKEETFEFLQNVLTEVIALFPGKYIHIGGDEVTKENWQKCEKCQARIRQEGLKNERELQSYFVRRIEKFINSQGRTLVGWSEIREGGLAPNAVLMDWIGGAAESAGSGHDVVMTPTQFCYLDYYQSTNTPEPKAIGGYLPLPQVYAFEPVPANLDGPHRAHIIGAQANLWTEFIASPRHLQYMLFPRLCALAEVAWSPAGARSYSDFTNRLQMHYRRLEALGVNYRK